MSETKTPVPIIVRGDRGFHGYGEAFEDSYGAKVEVYESSAADGPHVWLKIEGGGANQDRRNSVTDTKPDIPQEMVSAAAYGCSCSSCLVGSRRALEAAGVGELIAAKDQRIAELQQALAVKNAAAKVDKDEVIAHLEREHARALRESSDLREKLARCHEGYVARGRTIDAYEADLTELCRSKAALKSELSSSRAGVERLRERIEALRAERNAAAAEWTEDTLRLRDRCERAEKALVGVLEPLMEALETHMGATRLLCEQSDSRRAAALWAKDLEQSETVMDKARAVRDEMAAARASLSPGKACGQPVPDLIGWVYNQRGEEIELDVEGKCADCGRLPAECVDDEHK